jgi:hypothetical protein
MRKFNKIFILLALFGLSICATAQVTIGSNKAPETFSVLELISENNNNGLRLPQMTTEQRDAMADANFKANPEAMGLQIFNTCTKCVETWNGAKWISACAPVLDGPIF